MLRKYKVEQYRNHLHCNECGEEMIKYKYLPVNPPKYTYMCPICKYMETTRTDYPNTEYKYIEEVI